MANFSFMDMDEQGIPGSEVALEGITSQQAPELDLSMLDATDQTGGFTALLKDPNFLRMLAGAGSKVSQGQPMGQAFGDVTQQMLRNRALQSAAAKQSQKQDTFMNMLMSRLQQDPTGKDLLGPKEDMDTLDSINITNEGITLKAPNRGKTVPTFPGAEKSLESITSQRAPELNMPDLRGSDLPGFSNGQQALTAEMLAGLDPEDIGMLLQAQQGAGGLQQQALRTLMGDVQQRRGLASQAGLQSQRLASTEAVALANAKAKIAERAAKAEAAKTAATTAQQRRLELESFKENLARTRPIKEDPMDQRRLEIAEARLKIAEDAEAGKLAADDAASMEIILNPDTDEKIALAEADMMNQKEDSNRVFYLDRTGINEMEMYSIPDDLYFNDVKVTPKFLKSLSQKSGKSLEEIIETLKEQYGG